MPIMFHSDIPVVNFTIGEGGKRGIELVRQAFDAHSSDPAAVVSIGWGRFVPDSALPFEAVVVSFYGRSQHAEIAAGVQRVSGLDVLFFASPNDYPKFAGKVLDFTDDRGFFLTTA